MKRKRDGKTEGVKILLTFMFLLSAAAGYHPVAGAEDQASSFAGSESISVVDCIGRRVNVPSGVRRIGCLYAFSGHVVAMLGRGQDIVAVSNGLKRDILLHRICPSIRDAVVPKFKGAINIEELINAAPDVVFVPGDIGRNEGERKKLEKLKIPCLVVEYVSIKEQQYAVNMIGQALGATERAAAFNQYYEVCLDRVHGGTESIHEAERVRVYHSVLEATRTDASVSLAMDWLKNAGVVNVAAGNKLKLLEGKNHASIEQIMLWNPEVIIVNEPGVGKFILQDRQWSCLEAVRKKRVYQMPIGISRCGHPGSIETPLALLWTAIKVYPALFSDIDMQAETKMFYRNFFNYELTNKLAARILRGQDMRKRKKKGG